MKYWIFPLLLVFIVSPSNAQGWISFDELPDTPIRYDGIYFHDENLGWTCNSDGQIFKTTDGGEDWKQVYSSPYYLRCIDFIDDQNGFVGTLNGELLRTEDGGETWNPVEDMALDPIHGICGLSHVGDNIYGVGIYSEPAYFIKSEDGGENWTYRPMYDFAHGLVSVHFLNEEVGYAGGNYSFDGGVLLRTTDGGNQWERLYTTGIFMNYIWKIDFVNDTLGFASVQGESYILKTVDGGKSWSPRFITTETIHMQGVGFLNENKGWVGPETTQPMYETNDGGETWIELEIPRYVNQFFRVNKETMYAAGGGVFKYSRDTTDLSTPVYTKAHGIEEISPNPFQSELHVEISIDQGTHAMLDLYKLDGKQIISFHDGRLNKGTHTFDLTPAEVKTLGTGEYILLLRTNEGFQSEKVLRLE